jgi:hypothetical protein
MKLQKRKSPELSTAQADMLTRFKRESVIGPAVPLNLSPGFPHPERGPTVAQYFRDKARKRREIGRHQLTSRPQ